MPDDFRTPVDILSNHVALIGREQPVVAQLLEGANTALQNASDVLEQRVDERTRELKNAQSELLVSARQPAA